MVIVDKVPLADEGLQVELQSVTSRAAKKRKGGSEKTVYEKFWTDARGWGKVRERKVSKIAPEQLNSAQQHVLDVVEEHVQSGDGPLRLIIPGRAGTGKSVVIQNLRLLLDKYKIEYAVLSFTGSSAFAIGGRTIHRTLRMHYSHRDGPGSHVNLAQMELHSVKFFLFDEMSFLGLSLFGYISQRLKAIYNTDEILGGKSVILAGDFAQLRPVMDRPLFVTGNELRDLEVKGAEAYATFNRVIFLKSMMRQSGSEEMQFREMLGRVRVGELTQEDESVFNSRNLDQLSTEEVIQFAESATFLYGERAAAEKYNEFRLEKLENVVEIKSRDICVHDPVPHVLKLAVGARVMLTRNLWIEAGAYNGAQGIVTIISDQLDSFGQPLFVMVKLDHWYGHCFGLRTGEVPVHAVDVLQHDPVTRVSWTRKQLPLQLSWGMTIHKAQGATLDRVVLSFPPPPSRDSLFFRFSPSVFYVAISRVRKLSHVCFATPFRPDLVKGPRNLHVAQWQQEEARLEALMQNLSVYSEEA